MTLIAVDSSGNGHDLGYTSDNPTLLEQCLDGHAATPSAFQQKGTAHGVIDSAVSTWAYNATQTFHLLFYGQALGAPATLQRTATSTGWALRTSGSAFVCHHRGGGFGGYDIACGTPAAGAWHLLSVALSPTASESWLDGSAVGGNGSLPGYTFTGTAATLTIANRQTLNAGSTTIIDEFALAAGHYGDLAEHQSLWDEVGDLAAFDSAMAALSPTAWYKFADGCGGWRVGSVAF